MRRSLPTKIQDGTRSVSRIPYLKKALLVGFTLSGLFGLWTLWTFTGRFAKDIYRETDLQQVPQKPVAIVFGAGYWPNGKLSAMLQDRMDAALELYHGGRVTKLLLSGDNRFVDYNEPAKMLEYALAHGVPREDVVLDFAGRRTYDTCYRARDIFQVDDVILVTQRYHLPRAVETCRAMEITAIGYVADRQPYPRRSFALYVGREVLALWGAWWDLSIRHPIPVLGDPLPIFATQEAINKDASSKNNPISTR